MRRSARRLLLASSNQGKLKDLSICLTGRFDLMLPSDFRLALHVDETGTTYLENARLKARAYFEATHTPTLGEDSGLEIDALDGAPGVFSARFEGLPEGPAKNGRILELLAEVRDSRRTARYRCSIVYLDPKGHEHRFDGECEGQIAREPAGDGGFGFDPIMYLPRLGKTLAQLTDEERLAVNHRGQAVQKLLRHLESRDGVYTGQH